MAVYKCCLCWTHRKRLTALNVKFKSLFRFVRCVRWRLNQQMAPWTCNRIRQHILHTDIFLLNGLLRAYILTTATSLKKLTAHEKKKSSQPSLKGKSVGANVWPHLFCLCKLLSGVKMRYCEASVVEKTFETLESATVFLKWLKLLLTSWVVRAIVVIY